MDRLRAGGTAVWTRGKAIHDPTVDFHTESRLLWQQSRALAPWNMSQCSALRGSGSEARGESRGPCLSEARMTADGGDATPDLSLSAESMLRIRDEVRERLVQQIHGLRIASRAFRNAGIHDRARRCEAEAVQLMQVVAGLDNPMSMLTFPTDNPGEQQDRE
jgi:hypothetical protein